MIPKEYADEIPVAWLTTLSWELQRARLSGGQWACIMSIWCRTYGANKAKREISLKNLTEDTGLTKSAVINALKKNIEMGIVRVHRKGTRNRPSVLAVNIDWRQAKENEETTCQAEESIPW